MRTTLTLDDDLASRLKELAHERGVPFKRVVNEAIRKGLDGSVARRRVEFPTYDMGKPLVDLTKVNELLAAEDEEEFIRKFLDQ